MSRFLLLLPLTGFIFLACQADKSNAQTDAWAEIIEMYTVNVDGENYSAGKQTYKEHKEYRGENEFGSIFYNSDGSVKGKTMMIYEDDPHNPVGYQYFDPNDSLLVFYQYSYNDKGEQLSTHAFQAGTNELLRIEAQKYDDQGNLKVKEIRNDKNQVVKRYNFQYDENGNETSMLVGDGDGGNIQQITYKITAYDEDKKWTEKWGFQNDIPKTYHKRMVKR